MVVTGLGALNGPCVGAEELWAAVVSAEPTPTHRAIVGFEPRRWLDRRTTQRTDLFAQIAIVAARLAHEDAGAPDDDPHRVAVVLGADKGGVHSFGEAVAAHLEGGDEAVPTLTALVSITNAAAAAVALDRGALGSTHAVASGCTSGTHAIVDGFRLVRDGLADVAFVGGSDASAGDDVTGRVMEAALRNLRVHTDEEVGRPFDADRSGFVHASGAAVLRLEPLDVARRRGAPIHAEVLGGANTVDGHDLVQPAPNGEGLVRSIRLALAEARCDPSQVGFVNCHGSGTRANDLAESAALEAVFGLPGPAVTSTKAVTGHTAAAAGAIEGLLTVQSIAKGLLPQVQWCRRVDPEIRADVVTGSDPRPWEPTIAVSNSLGLGGQNGTVVFGPVEKI